MGTKFQLGKVRKFKRRLVAAAAQRCGSPQCHGTVHFKNGHVATWSRDPNKAHAARRAEPALTWAACGARAPLSAGPGGSGARLRRQRLCQRSPPARSPRAPASRGRAALQSRAAAALSCVSFPRPASCPRRGSHGDHWGPPSQDLLHFTLVSASLSPSPLGDGI